jgi:hypothetical protein
LQGSACRGMPPRVRVHLTELRAAIVAETLQSGAAKPSPEVAAEVAVEYRHRLIATIGVK